MNSYYTLYPLVKDSITFESLWKRTEELISSLSGKCWTDMSDHDPGIALLQAATYNVSDLCYRASLPINDLLTIEPQQSVFPGEFGPENVLTCSPITVDDYRRVLLDLRSSDIRHCGDPIISDLVKQVDDWPERDDFLLRDACLMKAEQGFAWSYDQHKRTFHFSPDSPEYMLRGDYRLGLVPTNYTERSCKHLREAIRRYIELFMMKNRNLGEGVTEYFWFTPQDIPLRLSVELKEDVSDIELLVATIFIRIEQHIMPSPRRYSTEQLSSVGCDNETIFCGPNLRHGWIPELAKSCADPDCSQVINLSSLVNELLAMPEILSVTEFGIDHHADIRPLPNDNWSWELKRGRYPRLWGELPVSELCEKRSSPLTMVSKTGIRLHLDPMRLREALESKVRPTEASRVQYLTGKKRELSHYTPIGDRLPECYQSRIAAGSLNPTATMDYQRLLRLHQFLLPIDQLLSDFVAQLSELPRLLSFHNRVGKKRAYGTQWPYETKSAMHSFHKDYAGQLTAQRSNSVSILDENASITDNNARHELEILRYLLSYFGASVEYLSPGATDSEFLRTQQEYLAHQPNLGYNRLNMPEGTITGLQKRLSARIGSGSGCFDRRVNLGKLPFYLIEHRRLLPQAPVSSSDTEHSPKSFKIQDGHIVLKHAAGDAILKAGQLVDIIISDRDEPLLFQRIPIAKTIDDDFFLALRDNHQLQVNSDALQRAFDNGQLRWRNSLIWLHDFEHRLNYSDDQPDHPNLRKLASGSLSPYPVSAKPGDRIEIIPYGLGKDTGGGERWSMRVAIKEIDRIEGTLLIEKEEEEEFPDLNEASKYQWHFVDLPRGNVDRFSFVISLVFSRSLLDGQMVERTKLERWVRQQILTEAPAHIAVLVHWLDENNFTDFGITYQRWQSRGNPLGDDAFKILRMLAIGQIGAPELGIGIMRIASASQGAENRPPPEQEEYIIEHELFYVPSRTNNLSYGNQGD